MKKNAFVLILLAFVLKIQAQCVPQCGVYTLSSIPFSMQNGTGTPVVLGDDDTTGFIPLGFNFNYYCINYTQVKICSNGFITFDNSNFTTASTPYAQSLPSATAPNAVIAFNWNDLDPSAGGSISYMLIGTTPNQKFIVTYSAVPIWSTSPQVLNTGQIILSEADGSIEIHIATAGNNGWLTTTEGIEDATATQGMAVPGRNLSLWTAASSAHRWQNVMTPWPPINLGSSTVVCYGSPYTYTCDQLPGAISYNWSLPSGWTGSSNTSTINVTPVSQGTIAVSTTYSCGTSQNCTLAVSLLPAPVVTVTSYSPSVLCSGNSAVVALAGASTYTFYPGGTNSSSPVSVLPLSTTTYSIFGSDVNGCTSLAPVNILLSVNPSPSISVLNGTICLGESFNVNPSGAISYTYSFNGSSGIVVPSAAGTYDYYILGKNAFGCVSSATSNLVVKNVPNVQISATRLQICANQTNTLMASGAVSYTWAGGPQTAAWTVTPNTTTFYTVTGTNTEACTASRSFSVSVSPCLSLSEQTLSGSLMLYPNPSDGRPNVTLDENCQLFIVDAAGRKVYEKGFELKGKYTLELSFLPAGKYFVKALHPDYSSSCVWIKE